jgi:hypothetical protein
MNAQSKIATLRSIFSKIPKTNPIDLEKRYGGWYFIYYPATDDSGDITRGLATIRREDDDVFFEFSLADRNNIGNVLFRYKSLLFPLKKKLYIIGEEVHKGNEMSLAILNTATHAQSEKPGYLRGLYLGVALGSRHPVASKVILVYCGSVDSIPSPDKLNKYGYELGNFPPQLLYALKYREVDINTLEADEGREKCLFLMENRLNLRHVLRATMDEELETFRVHRQMMELTVQVSHKQNGHVTDFLDFEGRFSSYLNEANISNTCIFTAPHLDPSLVSIRIGFTADERLSPLERDNRIQQIYEWFREFMDKAPQNQYRWRLLFASNAGDPRSVVTNTYLPAGDVKQPPPKPPDGC